MRYVRCTAGSVWLDRTVGVPMYIWYFTHNYFTDFRTDMILLLNMIHVCLYERES